MIIFVFSDIEKFELLQGLGFVAKLKAKTREAEEVLNSLKEVTRIIVTANLKILESENRICGIDKREKEAMANQLLNLTDSLGLRDNEIKVIYDRIFFNHGLDLLKDLVKALHDSTNRPPIVEVANKIEKMRKEACASEPYNIEKLPRPEIIQRLIQEKFECSFPKVEHVLTSYSHLLENNNLPPKWKPYEAIKLESLTKKTD